MKKAHLFCSAAQILCKKLFGTNKKASERTPYYEKNAGIYKEQISFFSS